MLGDFVFWTVVCALALIFVYVGVRLGSFAYFRTRLEYLRAAMKELGKGD